MSSDPALFANAIVEATTHFADPSIVAKVSFGLGEAMRGTEVAQLDIRMADRGW
jgi:pyridoxal 5'-phosphate synthase pdxS subunit